MWQWIKDTLTKVLEWLIDVILWIPRKLWELLCDGLLAILNAIPVPEWLANLGSNFGGLPAGVAYFLQALELPAGLAIIGGAYGVRFIIRRLPFFG